MKKQNIILYLVCSLFLSGCLQSTAMVGPALTLASTGNISHAGISFLTNKAIKDETGMSTLELMSSKIDENKEKKNINKNENFIKLVKNNENFIKLVENNIYKTRKIIVQQNQSKTFN